MSDLTDLYQDLILDHNKSPRNCRAITGADRQAEGYNPLCGDRLTVFMNVEDDVIKEVTFEGTGCAISTASASLMTEFLKGKPIAEAEEAFHRFQAMLTENLGQGDASDMGKLEAFAGVGRFPARVKCATLAWHTVRAAMNGKEDSVTTE